MGGPLYSGYKFIFLVLGKPTEKQEMLNKICISNNLFRLYVFGGSCVSFFDWGGAVGVPPPGQAEPRAHTDVNFLTSPGIPGEKDPIRLVL